MLKEKLTFRRTLAGTILTVALVTGFMFANVYTNMQNSPNLTIEDFVDDPLRWVRAPTGWATNNTVGAGTAGIVDIYTIADAFSGFDAAIDDDDANIYEETDGNFTDNDQAAPHEELSGTTPYDTDFHVIVVYQFTKSQAYDNDAWNSSRVKAYINTTGFKNDASSVEMTKGSWYAGDDANTQRINFYLLDDDGGADDGNPLQIDIDSTYNCNVTIWYKG